MEDQQFSREPYTLYVANIPKTVPQSEIEDLFKPMDGYMDINLLKDKDTSQFKGVAFINFQTVENAQDAIRKYNKTIHLVNEKAFSQKRSPFYSIETISAYIEELLKEET